MTPERWRQIEDLYHAVHQHGIAVLENSDPELRREVERLLTEDTGAKLLDGRALELMEETGVRESPTGPQSELAGQAISHYKILDRLGAGGMGVVYRAFDTKLHRVVALKFLPPHVAHDNDLKRRLSEEARAASALDHPNIVVIHDIDEASGGDLFIAMAFHEGGTLRARMAAGPIPVKEALRIARQIASGLGRAHENGILHRDIKPGNVIVAKDGITRIIDFGLAKSTDATETADGLTKGTPLYMSPEQALGKAVDSRTDLWSLGAVLYEMLAGKPPFRGESQLQVMHAVVNNAAPKLAEIRPDLPAEIDGIVSRALQKDPSKRYQTAAEMESDLSATLTALEAPAQKPAGLRAFYVVPALVVVILAASVSIWFYQRAAKRHWAREVAIPEIARLRTEKKPLAAFRLMQEAERYLPGDAQMTQIASSLAHVVSVRSSPPGATIELKDYFSPADAWFPLGTTPLAKVNIPAGYFRWRISKAGVGQYESAPITEDIHGFIPEFNFPLGATAAAPEGMVAVPGVQYGDMVWSLGFIGPYSLPSFYIDRFEVTNRQYQEFVDNGAYQKRELWKEKFIRDGHELSWEMAMDLMRDSTGRPGPSTWEAGHYPAGQADYPVGGVSWYEAAAYAESVGKSLPVISQWFLAAPSSVARFVIPGSNFSAAPVPVGKYKGVGPWGTYDMAGNVAEWCWNETGHGGSRYLLGGGWNTASSEYFEPGELPPFDRIANSGFRCVRNSAPLPAETLAELRQSVKDFLHAKPVSDEIFRVYKAMYAYDRMPLNVKTEPVAQDRRDWRKEKVTFDAAYGNERMAAYLFIPANVRPPYQTVVFFPSARVLDIPNSSTLGDMKFIDYVIQSGRAVLYPVFKGTYERPAPTPGPDTVAGRETLIQESKDLGRSIDYLETRPDIDRNHIGYLGVSMGAALSVNFAAVEPRLKAVVMLDGGFYEKALPGADQADFAPRVKAATLLVTGKFDWIFLGKDALLPMLGAPEANKKAVILETAHDVSEQRSDMVREVLAWLDKYLGKVN